MWGWFGGSSSAQQRKDAPKKAILQLRTQLDMLRKRETHLQKLIDDQDSIARKNALTNKPAARTALRRKKAQEHSLEQTSQQIDMLENQIYSIEAANINQETLKAMKNAGQAMQGIHGNLTIDKVDKIMDELADHTSLVNEIGNAIANSPRTSEPIDEDELESELQAMEQEELDEKMLRTGNVPALPNTRLSDKTKVTVEEEDEEEELARLQAEMAT